MAFDHIAVIGGGAWGTALALTCARAGRQVTLWEHDAANAAQLANKRESLFLPGVRLDDRITIAADLADAARARAILLVVPAQAVRSAAKSLRVIARRAHARDRLRQGHRARQQKIHDRDRRRMRAERDAGDPVRTELCRRRGARPADRGDACRARRQACRKSSPRRSARRRFRPYHSTDMRGVEIGGATKNVLAIAAGVVTGRGLGASAGAALTTRGFAELTRFGKAFGAKPQTMMGLSGLGDLLLTCSSPQSRNFQFGVNLGQGQKPGTISTGLAEGAFTAPVLLEMARERSVDMPIAAAVAALLAETMTVDEAIKSLLTRPLKAEE